MKPQEEDTARARQDDRKASASLPRPGPPEQLRMGGKERDVELRKQKAGWRRLLRNRGFLCVQIKPPILSLCPQRGQRSLPRAQRGAATASAATIIHPRPTRSWERASCPHYPVLSRGPSLKTLYFSISSFILVARLMTELLPPQQICSPCCFFTISTVFAEVSATATTTCSSWL